MIYNAGTDCLTGDGLGRMCITSEGVVKRDELVVETVQIKYKIAIAMVLSGGYQVLRQIIIYLRF